MVESGFSGKGDFRGLFVFFFGHPSRRAFCFVAALLPFGKKVKEVDTRETLRNKGFWSDFLAHPDFRALGSAFSGFWGEMKLAFPPALGGWNKYTTAPFPPSLARRHFWGEGGGMFWRTAQIKARFVTKSRSDKRPAWKKQGNQKRYRERGKRKKKQRRRKWRRKRRKKRRRRRRIRRRRRRRRRRKKEEEKEEEKKKNNNKKKKNKNKKKKQ